MECLVRQRPFVRIIHSAELTMWRINRSCLYSDMDVQKDLYLSKGYG